MTSTQKTYFRILRSGKIKRYRFNFHDMKLRKTLKLNIASSYVNNGFCCFDSYNDVITFLAKCEPMQKDIVLDDIIMDMLTKLTKNAIRIQSKTRFKYEVSQDDIGNYENVYFDSKAHKWFRLVTPSYALACMDIIFNNFRDEIYQDIFSEIAFKVTQLIKLNHCEIMIRDDIPIFVFHTYINNRGNEKSYFAQILNAIKTTLENYSNHSKAQKMGYALTDIDSYEKVISPFLQNDDSKLTSQNITSYMRAIGTYNRFDNDNCLNRQDVIEFFQKCENDFSRKHIDKLKVVLNCTFNNMTIKQTHDYCVKNDIILSESAIGKMRLELRELWAKYDMKVEIQAHECDKMITYYKPLECYGKCESNSYIVESKNDSYMKISDKPTSPYNPHDSIINMNLDSLIIKDSNKCLALKKALKNNKLVNQNSNYAQWAIPYGEKCLQYKESFYYMLDSQDWLDSYLSDIRITNNYSVKCVKTQNGVDTYYNNQLVRHTNYVTK